MNSVNGKNASDGNSSNSSNGDSCSCSYIIFSDLRFRKEALEELKALFGDFKREKGSTEKFFVVTSATQKREALSRFSKQNPVFIDNVIPLMLRTEFSNGDYSNVMDILSKRLDKKGSFAIEVVNVNSESGENAKTIEVKVGTALEKLGFKADLKDPDTFVYLILTGKSALLGMLDKTETAKKRIDEFRHASKQKDEKKISRASFKLVEAIENFGIDTKKLRIILDIGASPGSWSIHFSSLGAKVVAVDNALLNYEKFQKDKHIVVAAEPRFVDQTKELLAKLEKPPEVIEINKIDTARFDILHVRRRALDLPTHLLGSPKQFDLLAIDMNVEPEAAAEAANHYSDLLKEHGYLLLTVKLFDRKAKENIKKASEVLEKEFNSIRAKKLPHNRLELTIFATKR